MPAMDELEALSADICGPARPPQPNDRIILIRQWGYDISLENQNKNAGRYPQAIERYERLLVEPGLQVMFVLKAHTHLALLLEEREHKEEHRVAAEKAYAVCRRECPIGGNVLPTVEEELRDMRLKLDGLRGEEKRAAAVKDEEKVVPGRAGPRFEGKK